MEEPNSIAERGLAMFTRLQAVMSATSSNDRDVAFAAAMITILEQIGLAGDWKQIHAALKARMQREIRRN